MGKCKSSILMLQEKNSYGDCIMGDLSNIFKGWNFVVSDAISFLGGLIMGWGYILNTNTWAVDTGLEASLFSQDLGKAINIINIYGPYSNRQVF